MYKSSSFTFVFKYFFPIFMLGGWAFGIYMFSMDTENFDSNFAKGMSVMYVWMAFFLVQMPFRLKNIEVTETGISFMDFGKKILIDFKDIHWVVQGDLAGPWFFTIKYYDIESGQDKKICYMPAQKNQKAFTVDEMTAFIWKKIVQLNPNYDKKNQPSLLKNTILITILGLPFLALFLYFMQGSFW
jgi:hypothetical protein